MGDHGGSYITLITEASATLNVIRRLRERDGEPVFTDLSDACATHPLTAALLYRSDPGIADIPDPDMPGRERICADMPGADLSRANLDRTQLHGVDLSEAKGLAQRQVDEADGSVSTRLPEGSTMPPHWISGSADEDTT